MSKIWWLLTALIALCGLIVVAILIFVDGLDPELASTVLLVDVSKAFMQLGIIGVLGGIVKWLFDQYSEEQAKAEELNGFRTETLRRLISTNARVRQAPIVIEASRTRRAYAEQMQVLIEVWLELSIIRHEIQTAGAEAFVSWEQLREYLVAMERWLEQILEEYRHVYPIIADTGSVSPDEEWTELQNLELLKDLLTAEQGQPYFQNYVQSYFQARDLMRQEIWSAVGVKTPAPEWVS